MLSSRARIIGPRLACQVLDYLGRCSPPISSGGGWGLVQMPGKQARRKDASRCSVCSRGHLDVRAPRSFEAFGAFPNLEQKLVVVDVPGPRFFSGVGSTVICEAFLRGVRRYVFPEKNVLFGGYVGTFLRFSVIFF